MKSIPIDIRREIDICETNYYLFERDFEELAKRKENQIYETNVTFFILLIKKTSAFMQWMNLPFFNLLLYTIM